MVHLRANLYLLVTVLLARTGETAAAGNKPQRSKWNWDEDDVGADGMPRGRPLIIAHRGASGMYPEHTSLAYEKADEQEADYVECDVTITKDLVLICSHEPWIQDISNVNSQLGPEHPDFRDRKTEYNMDDDDESYDWNDKGDKNGYFTYDFTLEELQTLRRKQALSYRDNLYDWRYTFVTFEEYLALARDLGFGVYPEIKHGAATNKVLSSRDVDDTIESLVLTALNAYGFNTTDSPCLIQAFEQTSLLKIRDSGSQLRTIFLLSKPDRTTDEDLDNFVELGVVGLGVNKNLLVITDNDNHIASLNTDLVDRIHSRGLQLHAYTFRNEYHSLNWEYGQDPYVEYETLTEMGLDGFFTDFPASLHRFFMAKRLESIVEQDCSSVKSLKETAWSLPTVLILTLLASNVIAR